MSPSVSIIITVHNRTTWLREALDSAVNQTYSETEVILIDDGSVTDDAERIASSYTEVHYQWQENQGLGGARNTGLAKTSGEFVVFLDDDDWLSQEAIAEKITFLEDNHRIGAVYSDLHLVDKNNKVIGRYYQHRKELPPSGDIYLELLPHNFIPPISMLWRRSAIEDAGGFPDWSTGEDWYLLIQVAERTNFNYLDKVLGGYRIHDTNLTRIVELTTRGYTRVQEMVIESKRFESLPKRPQAKVLSHYAVLQMMSGDPLLGRGYLRKARKLAPSYPVAFVLSVLSLLGQTTFRSVINFFRRTRYMLRPIPSATSIFLEYD